MNAKALSKKLSYILRHNPGDAGLVLDAGGWVGVAPLLASLKVGRELLDEVVAENSKKRFAFNADGTKIRAVQGHSIVVDLGLERLTPPDVLYHGTAAHLLSLILPEGIKRQTRQYVHLSDNKETAKQVGSRHGRPVILPVDAKAMCEDQFSFYRSENGVWLTDYVPPRYIMEAAPLLASLAKPEAKP